MATGLRPRALAGQAALSGVHTLRTLDDALALRAGLLASSRCVVVGDGVLGAEIAATARGMGLAVTMAGPQGNQAMTETLDQAEIPEFPGTRAAGCPFDPPPALRSLQGHGPLVKVKLWDGSTPWLVTRHAEQRALLADPRVSADITRPGYPRQAPYSGGPLSFILMDDPEHARLRRMVTAPFAVRRVEALRPVVRKIVDDLIDDLLAGPKPADLVEAFALPVPSLVICEETPASWPSCGRATIRSWSPERWRNCCATSTSPTADAAGSRSRTSRSPARSSAPVTG